eukprot:2616273-Amphidinium_carterae.1
MTLDGRTSEGFGAHLARKVPENGSLIDATCWGWSSVLSAEGAYFGHFFLGPAKDTVVVQCELRLV